MRIFAAHESKCLLYYIKHSPVCLRRPGLFYIIFYRYQENP